SARARPGAGVPPEDLGFETRTGMGLCCHRRKECFARISERDNYLRSQIASPYRLAKNHAQHQPNNSKNDGREHISQKMRAQGDPTESDQEDQRHSAANAEQSPMPCFKRRQDKKQELSVKQSGSDGVAAGKTVTRPIHERAVNERAMPVNNDLQPLVQQHAAGNGNDEGYERGPPSFPGE